MSLPGSSSCCKRPGETKDLVLRKTSDLAAQLSNGEWLASVPGTDPQKGHAAQLRRLPYARARRALAATTPTRSLKVVLPRMQGYVNQSIPQHPQLRKAERLMEERGDQRVQVYRATAEYLATINLGEAQKWSYELKTLPRPSGRATRVIYTEYDLPRETISPHDVIVDAEGIAWYSSFGEQNLGRLDPKTGKVTRISDRDDEAGIPDRPARPARGPRGQPVARQHVPGAHRASSTARRRSSPAGSCRPSRTSTRRRSTW